MIAKYKPLAGVDAFMLLRALFVVRQTFLRLRVHHRRLLSRRHPNVVFHSRFIFQCCFVTHRDILRVISNICYIIWAAYKSTQSATRHNVNTNQTITVTCSMPMRSRQAARSVFTSLGINNYPQR